MLLTLCVVTGEIFVQPAVAQEGRAVTATDRYPLEFSTTVYIPCANAGVGEWFLLSGSLNVTFHVTIFPDGRVIFKLHNDWPAQSWTAVGQTTGQELVAHGSFEQVMTVGRAQVMVTRARIQLVDPGLGDTYYLSQLWRITLLPNGTIAAEIDRFVAECPTRNE
jgi:hypothetical protein